ncbi:MAG TPA: outer membrane protein assembly factor BamE [Thalassobaculum sp.]
MLGLAACSSQISTHGNLVDPDALAKVEPGRSDQGTVLSLLGSPSTRGNFGEPTWYYIGQKTERQAFYKPETIERKVVYIDFEPTGVVKSIGTLDLEDGSKVAYVTRETPTAGQRITLVKQLIGNIGRFNTEPE